MNHYLRLMSVYSAEAERLKTQKSLVLRLHGKDDNFWKVQVVGSSIRLVCHFIRIFAGGGR